MYRVLLIFAAAFWATGTFAQTVRVTAWDMQATFYGGTTTAEAISRTAAQIKPIEPDVLLLRGVSGWKMCGLLAEALKPTDYYVVVCSSYPESTNQVGILAKSPAYFSWSEAWSAGPPGAGGYAFAALNIGGHRFGFTSLEFPKGTTVQTQAAARQWLETLNSYRHWANNRLEGFITDTYGLNPKDEETAHLLQVAGFTDPLTARTASSNVAGLIATHLVPSTEAPGGLLLSRFPETVEFGFRPAPVEVAAASAPPSPVTTTTAPPVQEASNYPTSAWIIGALSLLVLVLGGLVLMEFNTRRSLARLHERHVTMLPSTTTSYNIVVTPTTASHDAENKPVLRTVQTFQAPAPMPDPNVELRQGLMAHLAQWFKQSFIQRLVKDRARLMATQQTATLQVMAIDKRLAKLEARIKEENSGYEKKIEELNKQLLTAREENLELIRAQIRNLKYEMDANRVRLLESEES